MTNILESERARPESSDPSAATTSLLAVVGFDGTEPSQAALEFATELIRGRNGHLEVVYVGHVPAYATMSPPAIAGIREGFSVMASELMGTVGAALDGREPRWHFQRRDGSPSSSDPRST